LTDQVIRMLCSTLMVAMVSAPGSVEAYQLRQCDSGMLLIWPYPVVHVWVPAEGAAIDGAQGVACVAFRRWAEAGLPVRVDCQWQDAAVVGPSLDQGSVVEHRANEDWVVVRFEDRSWEYGESAAALTLTRFDQEQGRVFGTEILLNAVRYHWAVDAPVGGKVYDLEDVLTHEAGHVFGLGHSDDLEATMYMETPPGERGKRSLSADDLAGLRQLDEQMIHLRQHDGVASPDATERTSSGVGCGLVPRAAPAVLPMVAFVLLLIRRRRRS